MLDGEILLIDGIEYSLRTPKKEDELEKSVKFHSNQIFGHDSIYFDVKSEIATSIGLRTVPDAYLIDFKNGAFYIIEIELSTHPEYDHINKQIGRFIGALANYKTRQKIARILKDYIDKDIVKIKFVNDKIGNREIYQFFLEDILENVKEQNYHTIIVIDRITKNISEACSILSPKPKILEFRTFIRSNVGDLRVHCHQFKPLVSAKIEKGEPPKPIRKGFTGRIPEKVNLLNETFAVKYWRDVLVRTAEILIEKKPDAFYSLADSETMKMDIHVWLSKNKNVMRDPRRLSNGLFISTGLSANSMYGLIKRLLEGCGFKESDIKIFLKD